MHLYSNKKKKSKRNLNYDSFAADCFLIHSVPPSFTLICVPDHFGNLLSFRDFCISSKKENRIQTNQKGST